MAESSLRSRGCIDSLYRQRPNWVGEDEGRLVCEEGEGEGEVSEVHVERVARAGRDLMELGSGIQGVCSYMWVFDTATGRCAPIAQTIVAIFSGGTEIYMDPKLALSDSMAVSLPLR